MKQVPRKNFSERKEEQWLSGVPLPQKTDGSWEEEG